MDYAANRQRSRSPIPLELNPVYKSSHLQRKESENIGAPLRDISDERKTPQYEPMQNEKKENFEFSYQRYQDKNYEFINKRIGEDDVSSKYPQN
jgi:hypothetical protein